MIYITKEGGPFKKGINFYWANGISCKLILSKVFYYFRIRYKPFKLFYGKYNIGNDTRFEKWLKN